MATGYLKQIAVAFDQTVNAIAGGWADETFSSRCHRNAVGSPGWAAARNVIDTVFFWEDEHCKASFLSEREGR